MGIKRYDIMSNSHDSWFVERENGDYCLYSDYKKLESEKAELIELLTRIKNDNNILTPSCSQDLYNTLNK